MHRGRRMADVTVGRCVNLGPGYQPTACIGVRPAPPTTGSAVKPPPGPAQPMASMRDAELLTLADREAQRLTDENDHCAAIIMKALAERLRENPRRTAIDAPR